MVGEEILKDRSKEMFGYILTFLVGGFVGVVLTCCVVVGKDNDNKENYTNDKEN